MSENNGWPDKHGVPLNPEMRGWHWLYLYNGLPYTAYWDGYWLINGSRIQAEDLNPQIKYWGGGMPHARRSGCAYCHRAQGCAGRSGAALGRTAQKSQLRPGLRNLD